MNIASTTEILASLDLPPKQTVRRGEILLYYKKTEAIEDFINRTGAYSAAFHLTNEKIAIGYRVSANRQKNCDTSNIEKSVGAASEQVAAIRSISDANMLDALPDELRTTALLRSQYPSATLDELALAHAEPLSKSGVYHRLQKILRFARQKGYI